MPVYTFPEFYFSSLNSVFILKHCPGPVDTGVKAFYELQPQQIQLNHASFLVPSLGSQSFNVELSHLDNSLKIQCDCYGMPGKLCVHQSQVLFNLLMRNELRIFFDDRLRQEKMKLAAKDYGLENESELDTFFELEFTGKNYLIKARIKGLIKLNKESDLYLKDHLLPKSSIPVFLGHHSAEGVKKVIVFREHKYYKHFYIELFEATESQNGKIKNPMVAIDPMDFIWGIENPAELKFYTAISKFRNTYDEERSDADIEGLKALVKNPLGFSVFYHDPKISPNVNAGSVVLVQLKLLKLDIRLRVSLKDSFYEVLGKLYLDDKGYDLEMLNLKYHYFLFYNRVMYLVDNPDFLRVIDFFKQHNNRILIHENKFEEFRSQVLSKLEDKIMITYSYVKKATPKQLKEGNFDLENEKLLYLSDSGEYVQLTPVMRYGDIEVPILSRKQIYALDGGGKPFTVRRDDERELKFVALIARQHPYFEEQTGLEFDGPMALDYFYIHRKHFIDHGWFLDAFDNLKREGIAILGFNQLKNNKLNPNKAKISIDVISGLDWFETGVDIRYGSQRVSLKHLHKSLRNKSNFVQLGDGTMGILPDEWIERFTTWFSSAEVTEQGLRMPKSNFASIAQMYEDEILSEKVKLELATYQSRIKGFDEIKDVEVPSGLNGVLRDYQKKGLHWLNFLDEFGFGGCLADDMGLGKTVQVLAFILSQKEKGQRTNLIVVPTTLIFNWQAEISKFTPTLKVYTIYGPGRVQHTNEFEQYDVVLTSYGTLLYDIRFLKKYHFNYVFLDESQTLKNPSSQRYQSVALLKSKGKIVLTGTPVENNTFDLYGQLSIACPGLLGNKTFFREHYSSPIDKFKDTKRAIELQKKISPFILRRTKKQVAPELPEKTEMVIYCEMGEEQQRVYDSYKEEYRNFLTTRKEEDLSKHSMHILKGLTQLRQICDAPCLLKDEVFYGDSSSKIDMLMEEISGKSDQHKILIFSQFVKMLDLIRDRLEQSGISFEYLTGQTKDREARVNRFQEDDQVRVFLISLKAGGMGLNLTEADYVYLVDPWWNPAVENQEIDRCYRIGQNKNVVAVRLICPGTIEEKVMKLQETKRLLVDDLIKTDADFLKSLSKKDLIELFD